MTAHVLPHRLDSSLSTLVCRSPFGIFIGHVFETGAAGGGWFCPRCHHYRAVNGGLTRWRDVHGSGWADQRKPDAHVALSVASSLAADKVEIISSRFRPGLERIELSAEDEAFLEERERTQAEVQPLATGVPAAVVAPPDPTPAPRVRHPQRFRVEVSQDLVRSVFVTRFRPPAGVTVVDGIPADSELVEAVFHAERGVVALFWTSQSGYVVPDGAPWPVLQVALRKRALP